MRTIRAVLWGLAMAAAVVQLGSAATDVPAAPRLKCRTEPGPAGLLVKAYSGGTVIDIECQTLGIRVGNTTVWHRTSDNCYVTDRYMDVSGFSGTEPQCADIDRVRPCRTIGAAGAAIVKQYEGFIAKPRPDISGLPTIGFGHQCTSTSCAETGLTFPFTRDEAHVLLLRDIDGATQCLARALSDSVTLNANQWAAMASWTLGVGCDMAAGSQLVVRLNRGEPPDSVAAHELPRWHILHGKRIPELVSRRTDELYLFTTTSPHQAHPLCAPQTA